MTTMDRALVAYMITVSVWLLAAFSIKGIDIYCAKVLRYESNIKARKELHAIALVCWCFIIIGSIAFWFLRVFKII